MITLRLTAQEYDDLRTAVDMVDSHLTLRRTMHRALGLPTRVGAGPLQKRLRRIDLNAARVKDAS